MVFLPPTLVKPSSSPHSPKSILFLAIIRKQIDIKNYRRRTFVCFVLFRNLILIKQEKQ